MVAETETIGTSTLTINALIRLAIAGLVTTSSGASSAAFAFLFLLVAIAAVFEVKSEGPKQQLFPSLNLMASYQVQTNLSVENMQTSI